MTVHGRSRYLDRDPRWCEVLRGGIIFAFDVNVWVAANGPLGYSGVLIFNPAGKLIGRIRLPEICANLSFGGPKRNILFMTASQSLYLITTGTQGAHPG